MDPCEISFSRKEIVGSLRDELQSKEIHGVLRDMRVYRGLSWQQLGGGGAAQAWSPAPRAAPPGLTETRLFMSQTKFPAAYFLINKIT